MEITQQKNGRYKLELYADTYDEYTQEVFFSEEDDTERVRGLNGTSYEITNEGNNEGISQSFKKTFDTFEEAKDESEKMLKEIEGNREIVRKNKKSEKYYVSI